MPRFFSVVLASLLVSGFSGFLRAADQPNFVFLFTDDQTYDALGAAGNETIHTPSMDRLAERGVRFRHAFVTTSICSASRAASLTGRYGSANGVSANHARLNEGERTFAQILGEAGYRTALVGKWHLDRTPKELGFQTATYFDGNGGYFDRKVMERGREKNVSGYIEDYLADRSIEVLREASASGRPFVLWHCTQVPHMRPGTPRWKVGEDTLRRYGDPSEMSVPATWDSGLSGKPPYLKTARSRGKALSYGYDKKGNIRKHKRLYYGAITEMDAALGRVLDALDRLDLRKNTYVFLVGDNGWMIGEHGFTSKVLAYEPSIRVPMLIAGPEIDPAVRDELVLNIDVAPTMLDLAGLPIPQRMHGRSLVPLLRGGEKVDWRKRILYEAPEPALGSHPTYALRTGRYKYIQTYDLNAPHGPGDAPSFVEQYDLKRDPHETHNLAKDSAHRATQKQLADWLQRLRRRFAGKEKRTDD